MVPGEFTLKLHIELTNRCVLECAGCPRTQWKEIVKQNVEKADLDVDSFERFMDCPGGKKIDHFSLCGDYGDTIYYPRLFDFLERFRNNRYFTIYTNGSYRDVSFWNRLAGTLNHQDTIIFSIDGLEHTNHIYRKNSNWASIMTGLDIMAKSQAKVRWKTIIFDYNINQLSEIKQFAEEKGAVFTAEKTHRYGSDLSLMPKDQEMIETNHLYEYQYSNDNTIEIDPGCEQEKTVTCDGYFLPCDWIRNPRTFYKSQLWKQKQRWLEKLNIQHINYDEGTLVVKDWANYVRESSLKHLPTVDVLCKMKCRKGCRKSKYIEI